MMKFPNIQQLSKSLLPYEFNFNNILFTFFTIISIRLLFEFQIQKIITPHMFFFEVTHTLLFFYIFFIICVFLLARIAKIKYPLNISLVLFAFIFVIFPPLLDWGISTIFFNGTSFLSYYLFDSVSGLLESFLTFFGDKPRDGITYGSRIMVALAIIFFSTITYLNTKSLLRTLLMAIATYTVSFFLSSLPSIITFIISSKHLLASSYDVAATIASPTSILSNQIPSLIISINVKMTFIYLFISIFLTLFILYKQYKSVFISLIKNIRPIQTLYHLGLLCIGIVLAIVFVNALFVPSFFTILAFILLCIAIVFAWYSTVIFNDCVDQDIDKISNNNRPLIQKIISVPDYKRVGLVLAITSIIIVMTINAYAAFSLLIYHSLSYLYNTPPIRLKRFTFISTFVASVASFMIVSIGFIIVSPEHSMAGFPSHITLLLIIAYTISLPIKDLKDIAGDKANNIYTIPVVFGENIGRILIASGIFISFILSIFALNTKSILIPAILSGTLCFWTLVGRKKDKFIFTPQQTILIVFLIASIYTLILGLSLLS